MFSMKSGSFKSLVEIMSAYVHAWTGLFSVQANKHGSFSQTCVWINYIGRKILFLFEGLLAIKGLSQK